MAELIRMPRAAWRQQPQNLIDVNWGNSLAADCAFLLCTESLKDVVSNKLPLYRTVTREVVGDAVGLVASGSYNATHYDLELLTGNGSYSGDFTLCALCNTNTSKISSVISYSTPNSPYSQVGIYINSQDFSYVSGKLSADSYSGGPLYVSAGSAIIAGQSAIFFVSRINGVSSLYKNGVLLATGTLNSTISGSGGVLSIGGGPQGDSRFVHLEPIFYAAAWNRGLFSAEVSDLSENPWQIVRPRPSRFILVPDAAGAGSDLAGAATAQATATGALTTQIPVTGAALSVATATGSLSTSLSLGGPASVVSTASGDLKMTLSLAGSALANAAAAGNLVHTVGVFGNAVGQATATGNMGIASGGLVGDAVAQATATGNVTMTFALSGAALAQATATGNMTAMAEGALAGDAVAQATATGAMSSSIPLAGLAQAWATGGGNVSTLIPFASAAAAVFAATGDLLVTLNFNLSANALAQATAGGHLTLTMPLSGSALSRATASGALGLDGDTWVPSARRTLVARSGQRTLRAKPGQRRMFA